MALLDFLQLDAFQHHRVSVCLMVMKHVLILSLILGFSPSVFADAGLPEEVAKHAKGEFRLVFSDDFDRVESNESKEEVGNGWVTNSQRRAKGAKQVDLVDSSIVITMAKEADHGVSVKHDAPFRNGIVRARFQLHDSRGIGFNFNDPKCKVSHAGHICALSVKPKKVTFRDGKTGIFDLKIREKKLAGASKKEISKLTEGKFAYVDVDLEKERWHEVIILIQGESMTAWINGKSVGMLNSPGIGHEVKQNLAFAVSGRATVDWVHVWALE